MQRLATTTMMTSDLPRVRCKIVPPRWWHQVREYHDKHEEDEVDGISLNDRALPLRALNAIQELWASVLVVYLLFSHTYMSNSMFMRTRKKHSGATVVQTL